MTRYLNVRIMETIVQTKKKMETIVFGPSKLQKSKYKDKFAKKVEFLD